MLSILLGISLIAWGSGIIINPKYYDSHHRMYYDFTGIEWYFGGLLIILGVAFIFTEIRKRHKN